MSNAPEVALVEARVLEAPRGLRAAWHRAREIVAAHPSLFDGCDVRLQRTGNRATLEAIAARLPALRPDRGDLIGSFAKEEEWRVADELAALRPAWPLVALGVRLDASLAGCAWPNAISTRPPGPPGLVASRVVDETWLWLSVPWTTRGSSAQVPDALSPLLQRVGAPRWSRFDHASLEAPSTRQRADLRALTEELGRRVGLSFVDEATGTTSPRGLSASFRRAIAPLGFVLDPRRSEVRISVLTRTTPRGNVASLALDLAGVAPGPWSPAVDLTVTGLTNEVRVSIARAARVTTEATWATRCAAITGALTELERVDAGRIDELLGPAPAWLAQLGSTLTPHAR